MSVAIVLGGFWYLCACSGDHGVYPCGPTEDLQLELHCFSPWTQAFGNLGVSFWKEPDSKYFQLCRLSGSL